jgi:dipeptidyl-peptidase-3
VRRVISETTIADNLVNAILRHHRTAWVTQVSNYYPGLQVSRDEIATVSKVMEAASIEPENTRLRKIVDNDENIFEVLQASAETDVKELRPAPGSDIRVRLVRGDRSEEIGSICKQ